ncbi:MAG: IclR family transcriptional regulator [Hyphomicrobiales bacterium]|nr:IclR family transcriptional regulator [Hyphomicrobiales bacterium]
MNLEINSLDTAPGAQSIGRALAVLRLLGASPKHGASLSELVAESGLMKPTCRRILLALMEAGLVEQDSGSRRYYLGPELYVLGMIAAERFGIDRLALDCVGRLAQKTGDAAFLQVRRGSVVVCLAREDGTYPIRSHVLAAGDRHPLGVGAGPLAILAALEDPEVAAMMAANARLLETKYPMLSRPQILDLVAETRARGYSLNRGLLFPGSWGMGMAIRTPSGRIEACLSLAAVENRMQPDREPQLAAWLAEEVRLVEQRLCASHQSETRIPPGAVRRRKPEGEEP